MKKALLNITNFLFFLFCTIAVVDAQTAPTVVKEAFNVRQGGQLTLNSEYGTIDVKSTNRNSVDVVFTKSLKSGGNIIIGGLTRSELDRLIRELIADFGPAFEQKGSNVFITGEFKQGLEYWKRRFPQAHMVFLMKAKIEFQVTVPRRYDVDLTTGSGEISVDNIGGSVTVEAGFGDVQLTDVSGAAHAQTDSGEITVEGCESKVEAITGFGAIQLTDVSGAAHAQTDSGEITVEGCESKVEAITGFGAIQLTDVSGAVNAQTDSGEISVDNIGGSVTVETGFGDVQLTDVSGAAHAQTDSGEITVEGCESKVEAITGFGAIQLTDVSGAVNAQTDSGEISVGNIGGSVTVETGFGDVQLTDVSGAAHAQTDSGEITVSLVSSIAVDVDALSKSGRVSSDFPVRGEKKKNSLKGTINGGGPLLKLRTSYGDIRLLRKGR